ncbi:hypothetical protein RQP46_001634 [Phenoliferia psychrophenolica]
MRDVVEEYHQKSREDIKSLHVEMLRQTFAQKNDTRTLMEEFLGGELARLREENAALRAENDRLRSPAKPATFVDKLKNGLTKVKDAVTGKK